ncbi:MAG: hypothetical protein ACTSYM_10190 [Candidatus Baldrarchaeia archaeon]
MWSSRKVMGLILVIVVLAYLIPLSVFGLTLSQTFVKPIENWSFENEMSYWSGSYGKRSSTRVLHDNYSLYTSAGGDWKIEQQLSTDIVNIVKGRKVMFSFWFYPTSVAEDGSKNYARAEIYYEYETSSGGGGGGGCPYVYVWDGKQYLIDNNILQESEYSNGEDVEDYYMLRVVPKPRNKTYSILIREFETEHSYIDVAKLLIIYHFPGTYVIVDSSGKIVAYRNITIPISCINDNGEDILRLINATNDGYYYTGRPGNYVVANFGKIDASGRPKLIIRGNAYIKSPTIYVQVIDETGNWINVTKISTRKFWSYKIINLPEDLLDSGELKVRLCFTSTHRIDYIGLVTEEINNYTVREAHLIKAIHSVEGNVKSKLKNEDGIYAEIESGDQIRLEFKEFCNCKFENKTFVLYTKGHYVHVDTIVKRGNPTYSAYAYGNWVHPTETKWHGAYVTVTLPSTTTKVKVIIHGKPDFKAYIDCAYLYLVSNSKKETNWGSVSLVYAIEYYVEGPSTSTVVFIPSVFIKSNTGSNYYVRRVEFKVSMEQGSNPSLHIRYATQANEEEYDSIKRIKTEEKINDRFAQIAGWAIGFIVGTTAKTVLKFDAVTASLLGKFAGTGVAWLVDYLYEPTREFATGVGGSVYMDLPYPTGPKYEYLGEYVTDFVSDVECKFVITWNFDSFYSAKVKIRVYVEWGLAKSGISPYPYTGYYWVLEYAGTTVIEDYITIT